MKKIKIFDVFTNMYFVILSFITILPFYLIVIASLTNEQEISKNGYTLFPKELILDAYRYIFSGSTNVLNSYKITIIITIIGTFFGVMFTSMLSYALTKTDMRFSKQLSLFVYLPFIFNGGIVPFYILLHNLGFKDSIYGLIIPLLLNPFNVFLMVNFLKSLPKSLFEAAKIDGANEFRIFFKIVMPLSKAGNATLILFTMLAYWNDWYLSLLLIDDNKKFPLQFLLRQIISNAEIARTNPELSGMIPKESYKMAAVVLTIGPIIAAYPYLQKYFIKGMTIGAVKE